MNPFADRLHVMAKQLAAAILVGMRGLTDQEREQLHGLALELDTMSAEIAALAEANREPTSRERATIIPWPKRRGVVPTTPSTPPSAA